MKYVRGHGYTPMTPEKFWAKVEQGEGCWEWQGLRYTKGYGKVTWKGSLQGAHRVAYSLAYGPIPPGLFICHHCDNPPCVRPGHLYAGTRKDNARDYKIRGDHSTPRRYVVFRGSRNGQAKLTEELVVEIRRRHARGEASVSRLAREYGMSSGSMGLVVRGILWKHVPMGRR